MNEGATPPANPRPPQAGRANDGVVALMRKTITILGTLSVAVLGTVEPVLGGIGWLW